MGFKLDMIINDNYTKLNSVDLHILTYIMHQTKYCRACQTMQRFYCNSAPHYAKIEF